MKKGILLQYKNERDEGNVIVRNVCIIFWITERNVSPSVNSQNMKC